ncbi:MAG: hypothetical protein H6598_03090 [Flavobacteriales bacterium]|nr:hypothetical protein [Flavobacteriales bacterium]
MTTRILLFLILPLLFSCEFENQETESETNENRELGESGFTSYTPKAPSAYGKEYQEASILLEKNDLEGAKKIYIKLLNLDKYKELPYCGLGGIYRMTNQLDSAFYCYQKVLEIDSIEICGLLGIAGHYCDQYDYENALKIYRTANQHFPNEPDIYRGFIYVFHRTYELDSAKFYAQKFLQLSPNSVHKDYMKDLINGTYD